MHLTKRSIDAATYAGGTDYRWDDQLPGFGLRVYPSGKKSFAVSYRVKGKKRIMILGPYGRLTLQQARAKARRVLADATDGSDPAQARQRALQAPMVTDLADRYLREHAEVRKKAKSIEEDRRNWSKHILPALGTRKVEDITPDDVRSLHTKMQKTPYAANRVLALLSKAFNLAEVWGWRGQHSNPTRHVERYQEQRQERFLSSEELARLGAALANAEDAQTELPQAIAAIRLLLLTGCRKGEVLTLKWEYLDTERSCLWLPASKTGAKAVPLGAAAVELMESLPRHSEYMLPGRNGDGHLIGLHRSWARIRAAAKLDDVRLHDLRHSFASVGASDGMGLPIIGGLLGHKHPATTARYAHLAAHPLKVAADVISGEIASALSAKTHETGTNGEPTMDGTIREADPKDTAQIQEVQKRITDDRKNSHTLALISEDDLQFYRDRDDHVIFVYESGETILGYVEAQDSQVCEEGWRMFSIFVDPDQQGSGIGKCLLEHLITWARTTKSVKGIEGYVLKTNKRALGFYKNRGFTEKQLHNEQEEVSVYIDTPSPSQR